ncbi:RHOD [Musa troglodytarum]|nr:RHOD [Musa troglodytarum]
MESYKCCLCFTRKFLWSEAQPPADVRAAFDAHSEGGTQMTADQFRRFLAEAQGDAAVADVERVMEQALELRHRQLFHRKHFKPVFTLDDFHHYLFSEELNPPLRSQVHQDMTAPLSHYYIYTGHNSYLTGNQLSSDCSDVPIIKALQNGVRVIELDMWPNATKDNIDILHGRTLTSPVELIKCLRSIKEYAFSASPYPVIITLEDHLTPDLQAKVAEMVIETFGDMLYYPDSESPKEFLSPEALKKRIIISTKPPKEYLEAKNVKENDGDTKKVQESNEAWGMEVPDLQTELECSDKGHGRSLWLMHGFYKANGGCGYVKKPDFLLSTGSDNEVFDPKAILPVKKTLKVKVYMGDGWRMDFKKTHFDPYSPPDFYTREHAFEASPYPVIITLEDHLTPNLQAKVAKMLTKTFGNILYTPTLESLEIKEKEHEGQKVDEEAWSEEVSDHEAITNDHELNEHYQEEDPEEGNGKPPIKYKRLIAIAAKKMQGDLTEALKIDPHKVTRLSLSELALEKAASSHGTELIRFTQRNLLRIFPKGTRVTSSNYKPLLGWMHGAQMVALNMQGYGKPLWLVHGMFKANGGCGYVKKPDILLNDDPDQLFDPKATLPLLKTLKVRIYTGDGWRFDFHKSHFDTFSPPDFYARVGIAGVPVDTSTTMKQTKIINDCWMPVWDEEFEFELRVPELALLRIEVFEHDVSDQDDFAGQTCLPVWELRTGIRSVSLCDHKGRPLKSRRRTKNTAAAMTAGVAHLATAKLRRATFMASTPPPSQGRVYPSGGLLELIRSGVVRAIPPKDAAAALRTEGFRLLDVRPAWEHEKARVGGSLHVPFFVADTDPTPVTLLKKWVHFGYIGLWTGQHLTTINEQFLPQVEELVPDKEDKLLVACGEGLR